MSAFVSSRPRTGPHKCQKRPRNRTRNISVRRKRALLTVQTENRRLEETKNATEADLAKERARVEHLQGQLQEAKKQILKNALYADFIFYIYDGTNFPEYFFPAQAKLKLVVAESARRKCFNELQELKGNIRVFARIRPTSRRASHDEGTCPIVLDSDTGTHSPRKKVSTFWTSSPKSTRVLTLRFFCGNFIFLQVSVCWSITARTTTLSLTAFLARIPPKSLSLMRSKTLYRAPSTVTTSASWRMAKLAPGKLTPCLVAQVCIYSHTHTPCTHTYTHTHNTHLGGASSLLSKSSI